MSDAADDKATGTATASGEDEDDDVFQDEPIPQHSRWVGILEWFDEKVYILVGIAFLVAALLSLVYGALALGNSLLTSMFLPAGFSLQALFNINKGGAQDIIALVSDLLLTLIIMEVLGTVVHHLRDGETTLRPFLFIGIISATRGILAVGARLSVSSPLNDTEFNQDMIELGVNAIVIIALGITMNLIGKYLEIGAIPRHEHGLIVGRRSRSGKSVASQATSAGASTTISSVATRALFVLMVLIILIALALIALLVSLGRL
ncbi:MAG: hypothetical protein C5B60_12460 [Chloroflexi bacterium]|nr:MAG: hypothetical protein C5B60_12460 [Chloroflexota bacterium]